LTTIRTADESPGFRFLDGVSSFDRIVTDKPDTTSTALDQRRPHSSCCAKWVAWTQSGRKTQRGFVRENRGRALRLARSEIAWLIVMT